MTDYKELFEMKQKDWLLACKDIDALDKRLEFVINNKSESERLYHIHSERRIEELKAEVIKLKEEREINWAKWNYTELEEENTKLREALEPVSQCGNCGGCRDGAKKALEAK